MKQRIKTCLAAALLMSLTLVTIMREPVIHRMMLRKSVASHVYYIMNADGTHGGTGFTVKAPSGKTYLLSNAHVCDALPGDIYVSNGLTRAIPAHIIESSRDTDLCILDAPVGDSGLSVGSEPETGQQVYAVGHPRLQPITFTTGEIVGKQKISVPVFFINSEADEARCNLPKNAIESFDIFIFQIKACVERIDSYNTTVAILPGSSGSPLVDDHGKVVGAMFAGDSSGPGWGFAVDWQSLTKFLGPY